MTETQQKILSVLDGYAYQSPRRIAERIDNPNWGGVARSLTALQEQGKVEKIVIGKQGKWTLWGWRARVPAAGKATAR
jgi:predicted HTH transcriptional regulator